MSHPTFKDRFAPSVRPRNNSHFTPSNPPPIGTTPNRSLTLPTSSSKFFPHDNSQTNNQVPFKPGGNSPYPVTAETEAGTSAGTGVSRPSQSRATPDHSSPTLNPTQTRLRQESIRKGWQQENASLDNDLRLERTLSPGSVAPSTVSDASSTSSKQGAGFNSTSFLSNMPRNASIDSAISSFSTIPTPSKSQTETRDLSPAGVQHLIDTAGSAEELILHLLREKNHAATQNTQLWKLVEKQRALLLGLNQDLQRVTKDRDKYKKKLKEWQSQESMPQAMTKSSSQDTDHYYAAGDAVKAPELSSPGSPVLLSTQSSTPKEVGSPIDAPGPAISTYPAVPDVVVPETMPRPDLKAQTTTLENPAISLIDATPLTEKPTKGFQNARKAPPKPLNLLQNNNNQTSPDVGIQTQDNAEGDDHRGRRKTREEDDRDRELSLKKEQDARSKSKKKPAPLPNLNESESKFLSPVPATFTPLPASPRPQMPGSAMALNTPQAGSLNERLISLPLKSPGLPATPRPLGLAAMGSLPMSPRAMATPLSPRAPKHPLPAPMNSPHPFAADPAVIARQNAMSRQAIANSQQVSHQQPPQERNPAPEAFMSTEAPPVFRGFVSSNYPNLLLPPNALPSIQIKVASSRLRPSRNSILGLRTQEDSTVFSLSIFERASRKELWRIEKIPATLPQLDQQLRPRCKDLPKMPDRKLFSGHSPALIDARREAVDNYFEELLDVEIDEQSAVLICRYLSTDVLDPSAELQKVPGVNQESMPQSMSSNGKVVKTGYLTKKGKNFGGWKSRYFVLESPELRYFETPGGPHLGTIKLTQAKIGTQRQDNSTNNESDDEYRHAFLIQEPKKKDSASYLRHVLCAESDVDRDQWVTALLHYVELEESGEADPSRSASMSSSSTRYHADHKSISSIKEKVSRTDGNHSNSPSPTSATSTTDSNLTESIAGNVSISGPLNGAPIQDSSQWGNRNASQPVSRDKSTKMSNIFHFKKSSQEQLGQLSRQQDSTGKPRTSRPNEHVRAVFGMPLADAVHLCPPFNVDVPLPAVVYRSIEYLRHRRAANEEGLFRLSGSNTEVKTLKERFNREGDIDLIEEDKLYDVHAVASLFKQYLRELPSPLLTRDLHIEFLRVLEPDSREDKITAFNYLVHKLPPVNFVLLRAVSKYLLEVTENSSKNKMSIRNMSIIFSPTINIPTPVFGLFLSEFDAIFDARPTLPPIDGSQIHSTELKVPTDLSPGDIRSPRRQMFSDIPTPAYHQTKFSEDSTTSAGSANMSEPSHHTSGSGEFGFVPLQPSYQIDAQPDTPRTLAFASLSNKQSDQAQPMDGNFQSLNGMIAPEHAAASKYR